MRHFSTALIRWVGAVFVTLALSQQGWSHEFWIEPRSSVLKLNDPLVADLKVGLDFHGAIFPYLHARFVRFSLLTRSERFEIGGEDGDAPAINLMQTKPGLNVITYHSTPDRLTYTDWQIFVSYAEEEGLTSLLRAHTDRGLPQTGFVELYTRCAKALVQIGPIAEGDQDVANGMPFEMVAESNPYSSSGSVAVKLTWQGRAQRNAQVTVFRDGGKVAKEKLITDDNGRVTVQTQGGGRFMLSAVHIEETVEDGASWHSHWASLTFQLP